MLKKQFSKSKPTCKVTFNLPKEAVNKGSKVELVGEWNDWNQKKAVPMKSSKGGYSASVELKTGRNYEFRYLLDKSKWENDWAADGYVPNPFGFDNSVVSVVSVPTQKATTKKATDKKAAPKKVTAKKAAPKKVTAKKAPAKKAAPKKVTAKKATTTRVSADDLKRIEGIGPKIAQLLYKADIYTFADLGKAKITTLKGILADAGSRYKMHDPTSWPKQSKLAARGKWDDLKKLQDKLMGGK